MKVEDFRVVLTQMFEEIEPAWRKQLVEHYRNVTTSQFNHWLEALAKPWPHDETNFTNRQKHDARETAQPGKYVGKQKPKADPDGYVPYESAPYGNVEWWTWLQGHKDRYFADYPKAERDANSIVDAAKQHFVEKQSKKLANACKNKTGKPKIEGKLTCGGVITGFLNVEYKGDSFTLTMSIITNSRHGKWGGFTMFNQFPARFTNVKKNKQPVIGQKISEAWMGENF